MPVTIPSKGGSQPPEESSTNQQRIFSRFSNLFSKITIKPHDRKYNSQSLRGDTNSIAVSCRYMWVRIYKKLRQR